MTVYKNENGSYTATYKGYVTTIYTCGISARLLAMRALTKMIWSNV
jgi:hypothetical protein